MARTPSSSGGGLTQLTIRLTQEQLRFLQEEEARMGNANENIRRILDDARSFLSLPVPLAQRLAQDGLTMGLRLSRYDDRCDYLTRLCAFRYEALLTGPRGT